MNPGQLLIALSDAGAEVSVIEDCLHVEPLDVALEYADEIAVHGPACIRLIELSRRMNLGLAYLRPLEDAHQTETRKYKRAYDLFVDLLTAYEAVYEGEETAA